MSTKEIWLPTSTTRAQVNEGSVKVWDDITFECRKVKQPVAIAALPPKDGKA